MQLDPLTLGSSQACYEDESCSVARTLEIVGDRWTWLIIRDAFLGMTRFDEFQESLGIARNVLTDRLSRLVDEGIFERVLYNERPKRYEYRLTEKGSDLFTPLNALRQWGIISSAKPMRLLRRKDDRPGRRGTRTRRSARSRRSRSSSYQGQASRATPPRSVRRSPRLPADRGERLPDRS